MKKVFIEGNGVEDENRETNSIPRHASKGKRRVADKREKNKVSMKMKIYIYIYFFRERGKIIDNCWKINDENSFRFIS